ncbi:2185_t:CDS:2 [Funneliformis mosseae]|uniref:2185_t:CDS:1 n=1 Tax=Funneliformis mosseae TaxID=27381 RepID=A0A9N9BMF0_FUNMO|nr:2185_t:CDS:2 [Funneliformis mosseae]
MNIFDLKEFMQSEGRNIRNPYLELSRRIPKFTAEQISHRWNYKLNPRRTKEERGAFINELKTIPKRPKKFKCQTAKSYLKKNSIRSALSIGSKECGPHIKRLLNRRVNNPKFLAQVSLTFGPHQDVQQSCITTTIVLPNITHFTFWYYYYHHHCLTSSSFTNVNS